MLPAVPKPMPWAAEINAAGGRALAVQADVGNEADVARLFEQALAHSAESIL